MIPAQDYEFLREAGVQAIFGPGTNLVKAAEEVLRLLGHNMPRPRKRRNDRRRAPCGAPARRSIPGWRRTARRQRARGRDRAVSARLPHPFPDAQAFEAAVAHDSERLARVDPAQVGMLDRDRNVRPAVGGVWRSARYNIRYMAAGAIAPTVPQPQCRLSIRLADPPEPARLAGEVASALKLADTHTLQVGLHIRHYWDLARPEGGRWRLMMKSRRARKGISSHSPCRSSRIRDDRSYRLDP